MDRNLTIYELLDAYDMDVETKGGLTGFWNRVKLQPSVDFVKAYPMKVLYTIVVSLRTSASELNTEYPKVKSPKSRESVRDRIPCISQDLESMKPRIKAA